MRILSLLPSATEIVCLLGLEEQLVGVSLDSDWPLDVVQRLPVLNTVSIDTDKMTSAEIDAAASDGHRGASLYHVDEDLLRDLRPDVILTQETCEVCAVSRRDVELATLTLGYAPHVLSLSPVTLDQVIEEIDLVARIAGIADHSVGVVNELRARLDSVRARAAGIPRPRVFCMEWLDPPYTAGHLGPRDGGPGWRTRRAWHAGWSIAPGCLGRCCRICARSDRTDAVQPGARACRRRIRCSTHAARLEPAAGGPVGAGVCRTHLFSRSGPRLVDGVEALARMLHPEVFSEPIPLHQALKVTFDGQQLEPYS